MPKIELPRIELPRDLAGKKITFDTEELNPESCAALIECLSESDENDPRVKLLKHLWDVLT